MNQSCPICALPDQKVRAGDFGERLRVSCKRCGEGFTITRTAAHQASATDARSKLSAWLRHRSNNYPPEFEITAESLATLVRSFPSYSVLDKQHLLLGALAQSSRSPGDRVPIRAELDYPLAWASGPAEFLFYIQTLSERKLIRHHPAVGMSDALTQEAVTVTPDGWALLDERQAGAVAGNQAFVAMSFSTELLPAWEAGIRPALERAHYQPYRTDAQPHIDRIDNKIVSEIRSSRLVVADVTQQRPGVYFEAGFAIGLNIPVFWCVREDEVDKVHFDTRQYNHIVWKSPSDFAEQLYYFVTAILGTGRAA